MAAGAWKVNPNAKVHLGNGSFDLSGAVLNMTLASVGASANILTAEISIFTSLGSQCTGGGERVMKLDNSPYNCYSGKRNYRKSHRGDSARDNGKADLYRMPLSQRAGGRG